MEDGGSGLNDVPRCRYCQAVVRQQIIVVVVTVQFKSK